MKRLSLLLTFALGFILSGCGGSYSPPQYTVTVSPSGTQAIDQGQQKNFTGSVANDTGSKGVTWSVSGGGTLSGSTATAVTYNAPTQVTSNVTATVTATSVTDTTKSASVTVTVTPPPAVTSTSPLAAGAVGVAYTPVTLQASGGAGALTWTLTSGTLPNGLALTSSTGVISGTPTAVGASTFTVQVADSGSPSLTATKQLSIAIAPGPLKITTTSLSGAAVGAGYNATLQSSGGTPPVTWTVTVGALPAGLSLNAGTGSITGAPTTIGPTSFTVKATDSATPTPQTATQPLSIVVSASGVSNSELNGQYAFLLSGFDAGGPVAIAGEFIADGAGHLTNGLQDVNRTSGVSTSQAFTGTYAIGADNRGTLTIGTATFAFAVGSITSGVAAKAHIVEFDSTGTNVVGVVEKQDPTAFSVAQFSGDYAFGAASAKAGGGRWAVAGRFTASGNALTSVVADTNDKGVVQAVPSFTGTYTVASNGRGTITLNPPGASTPVSASCYIVSASEALMMSIDPQTGTSANTLFAGSVLKQVGGPFGINSLSGTDVISLEGGGTAGTSDVQVGLLVPVGNGTFTLSTDENNAGTVTTNATSGTYTVAANGRVSVTGGIHPPVIYLVNQDKGFAMGTDTSVTTGFFEPQVGTNFTNASFSGNYIFGDQAPVASSSSLSSGIANPTGGFPGTISGTSDNNQIGTLVGGQTFTAAYTVSSNGRTTLGTAPNTNVMYIVSSSKAVFISTKSTNTNSTITVVEK